MSLSMEKEIQLSSYEVGQRDMNPFGDSEKFYFKSCKKSAVNTQEKNITPTVLNM